MDSLIKITYIVEYFDIDRGVWKRLAEYDEFTEAVDFITHWVYKDAERGWSFPYRVMKSVITCEGVFNG